MKEHVWETEEIDGGHLGVDDFWICKVCGASGGPYFYDEPDRKPTFDPFYADGMGLELSFDCDAAKQQIADHLAAGSPRCWGLDIVKGGYNYVVR